MMVTSFLEVVVVVVMIVVVVEVEVVEVVIFGGPLTVTAYTHTATATKVGGAVQLLETILMSCRIGLDWNLSFNLKSDETFKIVVHLICVWWIGNEIQTRRWKC